MYIILTFLGLCLGMGLVDKKGRVGGYWSKFWLTETPGFGKVMPRNRFADIMRYLHFVNNEYQEDLHEDQYWKVRLSFKIFIGKLQTEKIEMLNRFMFFCVLVYT